MKHVKLFEHFLNEMVRATDPAKQQLLQLPTNIDKSVIKAIKGWLKKGTFIEEKSMYSDPEAYTVEDLKEGINKLSKIRSIKRVEPGKIGGIFAEDKNGAVYKFQVDFVKSNKVGWTAVLQTPQGVKHGAGNPRVTTSGSSTTYSYTADYASFYAPASLEEFIDKVKAIAGMEYKTQA